MSAPHSPSPEPGPGPIPSPDLDPAFGPDADPGASPSPEPGVSIVDRLRTRLELRREDKLAELEDIQQAYVNAGAIALGETIDPGAKVVPHIEADRRIMRPIHRHREGDIASSARTHNKHAETLDTLAEYRRGRAEGMEAAHAGRTGYKHGRLLSEAERLKEVAEGAKTKSQTREQKEALLWEVRDEADSFLDALESGDISGLNTEGMRVLSRLIDKMFDKKPKSSAVDSIIHTLKSGDISGLNPAGMRVLGKLVKEVNADPVIDKSNDAITLGILYERNADSTNFDRSRNIAGQYVRGLTDKEIKHETKDLKAQYKRGEISRVQLERAIEGLKTKRIIEIPDERPEFGYGRGFEKRTARKAGKADRKAERRVKGVTETGASARLRQARIAHLREKLGYKHTPITPEYKKPASADTDDAATVTPEAPVLSREELHREEIRKHLRYAGVSASVRTALHDVPLDFIPNMPPSGNANIGDSEFARMLTEASTTEPQVLKEVLGKGYPELITIMGEGGKAPKIGTLDPHSPKAGEPMVVIRYETTNLGDRTDAAAASKYPYEVAGQPFVDFRAHLFVPESDAKELLAMIAANPAEIRNIVDVVMQEKLGAEQSWEAYHESRPPLYKEYVARPPYKTWDRINGGRPKIAVRHLK